jgi:hypothetical protein
MRSIGIPAVLLFAAFASGADAPPKASGTVAIDDLPKASGTLGGKRLKFLRKGSRTG